jgi:predicted anti-sigma-YlaC factor YlaD
MTDARPNAALPFPEELLSGYLDGALTQQQEQSVRLHLERSAEARATLEQLAALRQAARSTPFVPVEDRQWSEAPRTPGSALARRLGFTLLVIWLVAAVGVATWQAVLSPFGLAMTRGMIWWAAVLWVAIGAGGLLVFYSVLADRLHDFRSDRYRGVLK